MYCGKCGQKLKDGVAFCDKCGEKIELPAGAEEIMGKESVQSKKYQTVGIVTVSVVAVLVVAIICIAAFSGPGGVFGRGYEDTIEEYYEAIRECDGEQFLELLPDDVIDAMCKQTNMSRKQVVKQINEMFGNSASLLKNITYSIDSIDTEYLTKDELKDLKRQYKDEDIDINISNAMVATVKLTVEFAGMSNSTEQEIPLIKVGRSWYIDFDNFDMDFD